MAFQLPLFFSKGVPAKPLDGAARASTMMEYDQPLVWVVVLLMMLGIFCPVPGMSLFHQRLPRQNAPL